MGLRMTFVRTKNNPVMLFFLEWWGARHTFTVMGFMGLANLYAMRVNLSVAIVAMTNTGNYESHFNTHILNLQLVS